MSKIPGTNVDKSEWLRRETELPEPSEEGRCRFNCRTARANWIAGWLVASNDDERYLGITEERMHPLAEEAYREWKRRQA